MGARPSTFRGGGGILNNVVSTMSDYRWTDEVPSAEGPKPFVPGKIKDKNGKVKDKFHTLFLSVVVRPEGAEEDDSQSLFAGNADNFVISEDGKTLTSPNEGENVYLSKNSDAARFLASLVSPVDGGPGFDENRFSEADDSINLEPMLGARVKTIQQRLDAQEIKDRGLDPRGRQDKKNKERFYPHSRLVVSEYYGQENEKATPASATKAAASRPASSTKTAGKATAKPAASADVDMDALAAEVLTDLVANVKGNKFVGKTRLNMPIAMHPKVKELGLRDEVRGLILGSLAEVAANAGLNYDADTDTVSAQ